MVHWKSTTTPIEKSMKLLARENSKPMNGTLKAAGRECHLSNCYQDKYKLWCWNYITVYGFPQSYFNRRKKKNLSMLHYVHKYLHFHL